MSVFDMRNVYSTNGDLKNSLCEKEFPVFKASYIEEEHRPQGGFVVPDEDVQQGLHQRHLGMIALTGAIGSDTPSLGENSLTVVALDYFLVPVVQLQMLGIFFGLPCHLSSYVSPLGALLAYVSVGIIVCCVCYCVGETSALAPLSGAPIRHAEYFVDPALAVAYGWNIVYLSAISVPAESVASAVLFQFWTDVNPAIFITILGIAIYVSNMISVRWFGETEFIFAIIKLVLVVGLIIMGICIDAGASPSGEIIGLKYWRHPGVFGEYLFPGTLGQFLGFCSAFIGAAYAFSGVEGVSVCGAETKNAQVTIPRATKRVLYRVFLCYILTIFVVGLIVPWNNPALYDDSGTASASPFVIAANIAGIRILPSIINALILTSAWSSANHSAFAGSRILYGLALDRKAPKVFTTVNRAGIPWVSVSFICFWMVLGYMTLGSASATKVFGYLQDLASAASLTSWVIICGTSIRLGKGMRAQSIPRSDLPWAAFGQPYIGWIGLLGSTLILVSGGWDNFVTIEGVSNFSIEGFISSYFNIVFLAIIYFGWKIAKKTKVVGLREMPITYFIHRYRLSLRNPGNEGKAASDSPLEKVGNVLWG